MIPDTVPCRCGASVELKGGRQSARGPVRGSSSLVERVFWWAGGRCTACGFIVQYGQGGERGDYQHCRWWYIGKGAESLPGAVRRWPSDWGT